jgi:two-component system response regulator HupR/HoxA
MRFATNCCGAPYDISVLLTINPALVRLAARALHYNSRRWDKPFVVENCAAFPDDLLESSCLAASAAPLPARWKNIGLFERADGSTMHWMRSARSPPQVKL